MKPNITIKNNKIIIDGHYDNDILCGKLDLLCKLYNAKISRGHAELDYNKEFLNNLKFIDLSLNFGCDAEVGGGCTYSCSGDTKSCSCGDACKDSCTVCSTGCGGGCRNTCSGGCIGGCRGCTSCSGGCDSGCYSTCKGSCNETCKGGCQTSCSSTCKNYCLGGCQTGCDDGCTGQAVTPIYNAVNTLYTKLSLNEVIYAQDFTNIELLVRNEALRRNIKPVSNDEEVIGELIPRDSAALLVQDLKNMQQSFQAVASGDVTLASVVMAYIKSATDLYKKVINPGP